VKDLSDLESLRRYLEFNIEYIQDQLEVLHQSLIRVQEQLNELQRILESGFLAPQVKVVKSK